MEAQLKELREKHGDLPVYINHIEIDPVPFTNESIQMKYDEDFRKEYIDEDSVEYFKYLLIDF